MHTHTSSTRIQTWIRALLLVLMALLPDILIAQTNGMAATSVLGQTSFTANSSNGGGTVSGTVFNSPRDMVIDATTGKLFIIDINNNRVLRYTSVQAQQSGGSAEAVFGQANLTSNGAATTAGGLNGPAGLAIDGSGNLYIADRSNSRVLRYANAATAASGTTATAVFGQPNMTSGTANQGGTTTASTLNIPVGLAIDGSGNLYVADAGNNRVLRYANAATATNGTAATVVFGQLNMTSGFANQGGAISSNTLSAPFGLAIDGSGNLYVADQANNRVLRYANAATAMNGATASAVFGQPGVTSGNANNGGPSASTLSGPYSVSLDTFGNLYVADANNHRVLRYANAATATTSNPGPVATVVLGQQDFSSNSINRGGAPSASSLHFPRGVVTDASQNLYVADANNNRVLRFLLATTATASPTTVNFGTNFVGGATTTQSVTIAYASVSGNENFTYTLGGNTAGYTLTPTTLSTSGGTSVFNHTITISLNPTVATTQNAVLWVNRVLSGTTLATIPLSGNIFPVTTLTVSPSSLNLGTVTQFETSSDQTLTLTFNNIRAGERVTYSLTNDGGGAYTILNTNTGFTTTASQTVFTTTVTIRLNSNFTIGTKTGVLRISTNSSTTPTDIALNGSIAGINVSFTSTSLDFGNVILGAGYATTATRTVTMTWSNARVPTDITMTTTGSMFSREANFQLTTATGTRTITATYNPIAFGTHTGTLTITGGNPPALAMSRAKGSEDEIMAPANNAFTQDISLTGRAVPPPPVAPTISISNITSVGFIVSWNAPANTDSYRIDIATDANFANLAVNNASVNTTNYTATTLIGNTTYWARVRSVNGQGTSGNSNVVSALTIPGTVSVLSSNNLTSSTATLNWSAPSGDVGSYQIDVSLNAAFSSFVSGFSNLTVNGTSQAISGLTPGTPYFWRVRGVNATGISANSTVQNFTTLLPPVITSFSPTTIGQGQTLTLTGANYLAPMSIVIGGTTITATVISAGQATAVIPSTIVGVQSVGATTAGGSTTSSATLMVVAPPVISAVTWSSTVAGSTVAFTLNGSNFLNGNVTLTEYISEGIDAGTPAVNQWITSQSATQIILTLPINRVRIAGQYVFAVSNIAGTGRFQVAYVPPPILTSITPSSIGVGATRAAQQPIILTLIGQNIVDVTAPGLVPLYLIPQLRISGVNGDNASSQNIRDLVLNPFDITTRTNTFQVLLPSSLFGTIGNYTITLTTAGGSTSQTVSVVQDRFTVSGTLQRTDIVGAVSNATGTASTDMTGITVELSGTGFITRTQATATDGTYRFTDVPAGAYNVAYRSERFAITPSSRPLVMARDTVLSNLNEVRLLGYAISGVVSIVRGDGAVSVTQAEINYINTSGNTSASANGRVMSNAQGSFIIGNIPSGTYRIIPSSANGVFAPITVTITDRDRVINPLFLRGASVRSSFISTNVAVAGSANISSATDEFRNIPANATGGTVVISRISNSSDLVLTTRPTVNVVMNRDRGYEPIVLEARATPLDEKQLDGITQVAQERILRLGDTVALNDVQNGRVVYRPRGTQSQTDTISFNISYIVGGTTSVNTVITMRFNVAERPPRITAQTSLPEVRAFAGERPGVQWFISDLQGNFDFAGIDSARVVSAVSSNEGLIPRDNLTFSQFSRGRWLLTMQTRSNTTGTAIITANFAVNFNGFTEATTQSVRLVVTPASSVIIPVNTVIESMSPNPASEQVQIRFAGKRTEDTRITLINALGQTVQTQTAIRGSEGMVLDVSGLSSGTYRMVIHGSKGIATLPMVVVR
jgi:sugar lactone lactonase YvrE